jgi:hypothetical protein
MSLPWIPTGTAAVLSETRTYVYEATPPRWVMVTEVRAVIAGGEFDAWSQSQFARRWRVSGKKARAILVLAMRGTDEEPQLSTWRTAITEKFPALGAAIEPARNQPGTDEDPRARSSLKIEEEDRENAADAAGTNEPKSGIKAAQTRSATQTTIKLRTLIRSIKGEQDNKRKPSKELISLVKGRLDQGYTEEDLGWLVRWACLGTDEAARWFQQHEGGRFCNLDTLLRRGSQKGGAVDKFEKNRIPAMEAWRKAGCRIGGRWAANADEVVAQRKPQQAKGGIPSDDMVAVVLDIARQLREGARPLAVSWPRWLDVLDDRRVRLTAHVMRSPDDVATIDDPSKAKGLLEAA